MLVLLAVVALLQFGYPLTVFGRLWTGVYLMLHLVMITYSTLVARREKVRAPGATPVGILFGVSVLWHALQQGSETSQTVMFAAAALYTALVIAELSVFTFRKSKVGSGGLILAALSTYLLIGALFSAVYSLVALGSPESFAGAGERVDWRAMSYFSFTTQSTLGYGDITPMTVGARALSSLQSVTAALFLAIVIARLVSVWRRDARSAG